jgi:hypothetical protein
MKKQQQVIDFLDKKYNSFDLLREFEEAITSGKITMISIDELAYKYSIQNEYALELIKSEFGDQYNEKYITAGRYMISNSKADELRSLLTDITKFTDASSILAKNGIPESCHYDLITKLGFSIKRVKPTVDSKFSKTVLIIEKEK